MVQQQKLSKDLQQWADRLIGISRFQDSIWEFNDQSPGANKPRIDWRFVMPDGSLFTAPHWNNLRFPMQVLLYGLYTNRIHGSNLAGHTVRAVYLSVKQLARFMALNNCEDFSDLDAGLIDQFMQYLISQAVNRVHTTDDSAVYGHSANGSFDGATEEEEILFSVPSDELDDAVSSVEDEIMDEDEGEETRIAASSITGAVRLLNHIYEQTDVLLSEGISPLSEHPFQGATSKQAVARYVNFVVEKIPPVPDSLYLPATAKMIEWLGVPAQDIIKLQTAYLAAFNEVGYGDRDKLRAIIRDFRFSPLPGQDTPWRGPITAPEADTAKFFKDLRALIGELATVAIMSIGAFIGQRCSETLSLKALPLNPETSLPYCIEIQSSLDGLYDVFLIKGRLFKTRKTSEESVWTAGMRLKGSSELPPPILAIKVLYDLFAPWRGAAGINDLCVNFAQGGQGLPDIRKETCCVPKSATSLNDEQNAWIQKYVDVPSEYKNWRVTTTQWRKSFATYMVRVNPSLLRAVSEHFHHMSVAMTNNAYVSKDVKMRGLLESTAIKETAKAMHQMVTGKVRIGGKMAELVRERKAVIMARLAGKTEPEQLAELEDMVVDANVRIYACDWGWCLFRSATSRCNQYKGTDALLKSKGPDLAKRCPDTCHSCKNLAVTDDHRVFWEERQRKYEQHVQEHRAAGNIGVAAVAQERVEQAQSVLRLMDLTMDTSEGAE